MTTNRQLETMLRDSGFVPEEKREHVVWKHPTGVWTMTRRGSKPGEHRRLRSIRSAIHRAERLSALGVVEVFRGHR